MERKKHSKLLKKLKPNRLEIKGESVNLKKIKVEIHVLVKNYLKN